MKGRTVLILFSLGTLFWVIEASLDTFLFANQSFLNWLIFNVPSRELYLRFTALAMLVVTGIVFGKNSRSQESRVEDLAKSNANFASLLNNLPVGVYRTTPEGKVLQTNLQFAKILGYESPQELRYININEAYTNKSDRQAFLKRLQEAPVFGEFELRRKDDRMVWVREYPRATLNADGTIEYIDCVCVEARGIDAIIRDITEHKKLESMKNGFIVAVTHELRTPLVSIKGYIDHILAREPNVSDSLKSKIEVVQRNTDRLLELTNDLLSIQNMENGTLEIKLQKLNLAVALTQCIEEIQPILREKQQEVKLDIVDKNLLVSADRLRLSEVLMNILNNATKFTRDGGHIVIRAEGDRTSATVHIADDGIGIDKKDLDRVFEPFAVIGKPTYFKGTGLGMSLAKKLIEAQGGKIWVTSQGKGLGATFAFTLPTAKEEWMKVLG
jgi:PAS domain S-box-containing protein